MMDFEKQIGTKVGPQKIEYTWRDVVLYALAVGAHAEDQVYTYEKYLKTLPTFGVIPYWNAINNYPQRPGPKPACFVFMDRFEKELGRKAGALHSEHEIIFHRPIDPIKGSFVFEDEITDIYDRGEGKGIIVKSRLPVYDEAGNLICENNSGTIFFDGGGFGGIKPPKNEVEIPDRAPDYTVEDSMSPVQNLLYRLTGDTNPGHVDHDTAREAGFRGPIMQGLCSFGFAARMVLQQIIPYEPERVKRVAAQMRSVCYPGTKLRADLWGIGEGKVYFRLIDRESGKAILDRGVFVFS